MKLKSFIVILAIFSLSLKADAALVFSPVTKLTDNAHRYRLSKVGNSIMEFDSIEGKLHLVYWAGEDAVTSTMPSYIYYRTWTSSTGWSAQQSIADSFADSSLYIGGRHPSVAISGNGRLWTVWHDHRNCHSSPGNWIDNIEIYGDCKTAATDFTDTDIRLTNSTAGHLGDNGYSPKIISLNDNRFAIVWYDFSLDRTTSDLFLNMSDTNGNFNPDETISDMRLTNSSNRESGISYSVPDIAVDGNGFLHLVWTEGFGSIGNLYYGMATSEGILSSEQLFRANGANYNEPAHITSDKDGNIWIIWTDRRNQSNPDIYLIMYDILQSSFKDEIRVTAAPTFQRFADIEFTNDGLGYILWIDGEGIESKVIFSTFNSTANDLSEEIVIASNPGRWSNVSLELINDNSIMIIMERDLGTSDSGLYYTIGTYVKPSSVDNWQYYE